ncbi:putative thrombospondin type-1 domain-containing protein 7B isofor m X1 [Apostichopus japonicus]|uniref:Putative thrombospondin type-1 domain-containing protein 7B isofor m X1 n=1 Tax=Stichopus japonicus TaxID=307972 RepID=A0A2G8L7Z7_STIJA|nr:putative thrombospondin type-1 domain-containing protein 7B isofor m X1 [Apostichopus japonicus]
MACRRLGECLVRSLSPGASPCGVGMRQRDVSCLKIDEGGFTTIANSSLCPSESTPAIREVCSKPCFELFLALLQEEIQGHSAPCISRHRRLPLPDRISTLRINLNCFQYFWNASGWSSCMLGENAECGHGRKTRLLTCASVTGALVDNQLCEKFAFNAMPEITNVCSVECPLDCKMSVWSEWSTCPQTCGTHRLQTRSRTIIQNPNDRGRPCPSSLVQSRPCEAVPCYTFRHSDWGPCIAQGECGSGLRHRNVTCHQPEGQQVDFDLCLKFRSSLYHSNMNISQRGHELLQTVEECQVPCPGECQRGDWSQWSDCNIHCSDGRHLDTQGTQVRSRASLTLREDCPGDEVETRSCRGTVCYEFTWKTDEWNLGSRNVWCERSDGMIVTGGCSENLKPNVNAVCSKGCPVQNSFCSENELCSCMKKFKPMYSQESGMLAECVDAKWKESQGADLISVISTKSPDMTKDSNAGQLGDDMFGFDLHALNVGMGTKLKEGRLNLYYRFLTLLVWDSSHCDNCNDLHRLCNMLLLYKEEDQQEKDDKLPQPQYRDYQNSFWDESAKMKYTGEIDL